MNDKSDKELANSVVALGIGGRLGSPDNCKYCVHGMDRHLRAEPFVRDWRVAGALMERVRHLHMDFAYKNGWLVRAVSLEGNIHELTGEHRTRTIIEACVKALS